METGTILLDFQSLLCIVSSPNYLGCSAIQQADASGAFLAVSRI